MVFKGGAVKMYRLKKIDDGSGKFLVLDTLLVAPETQKAWDSRLTVEWEDAPTDDPRAACLLTPPARNSFPPDRPAKPWYDVRRFKGAHHNATYSNRSTLWKHN